MPLHILIALVVGGITGIALLLHLSGRSHRSELTEVSARAGWLRQFPDDDILSITLASDAHAALIHTSQGQGLLWSFGADTVARRLVGSRARATGTGVEIRFPDYAAPRTRLRLNAAERQVWLSLLEPS